MKDKSENYREEDNNRNDYSNRSIIDGENCSVSPEELKREMAKIEDKFQKTLHNLQQERNEQDKIYQKKVSEIYDNDQYKADIYGEKINQLQERKEREDKIYEEKIYSLKQEMSTAQENLQGNLGQLNQERDVQLQLVDDKIEQVKEEKMKYDELYRVQLEKIKIDNEYKQKVSQIKSAQEGTQEEHIERQKNLQKEKEYRESSFAKNFQKEYDSALVRLKEMEDYTVADKDPDVRGWKVIGRNDETIGTIDELIVDRDAMTVRYLEVDIDKHYTGNDHNRHILIPIGVAEIDRDDDHVLISTLDASLAKRIPTYNGDSVTRDYEKTLLDVLSPDYESSHTSGNFYDRKHFDTKKFYSPRRK